MLKTSNHFQDHCTEASHKPEHVMPIGGTCSNPAVPQFATSSISPTITAKVVSGKAVEAASQTPKMSPVNGTTKPPSAPAPVPAIPAHGSIFYVHLKKLPVYLAEEITLWYNKGFKCEIFVIVT